eukprot:gene10970-biopygen1802
MARKPPATARAAGTHPARTHCRFSHRRPRTAGGPGGTGQWRGHGAGVARAVSHFWLGVARAWRGRGAGMSCSPRSVPRRAAPSGAAGRSRSRAARARGRAGRPHHCIKGG